jgi:two-component system KDP operon response regulator KdpE
MTLGILLIEDAKDLRHTLRQALGLEGYRVQSAASLADAWALWNHANADSPFDVVLLDLGLPDGDGKDFLTQLRRQSPRPVPVIVISARQHDGEKVQLLDLGADDYLVKPFSINELLARIRVAMRHRGRAVVAAVTHYTQGDLEVDVAQHWVRYQGQPVHLTPTEFNLLARLVRNAGQVVTHRQLLGDVWGAEFTEHTHYLRLYMAQLRAKLEPDPAQPHYLLTEPGVGYRLAEAPH